MKKLIPLVILAIWLPLGLRAQTTSPTAAGLNQPVILGSELQAPLRFAEEAVATNQITLSLGASTFYDDNVFQNNSDRIKDEAASFNSNLTFLRQTENVSFSLNYLPNFILYKNTDEYDRLNHVGNLNLAYRVGSHFIVGLNDGLSYQNGVFQSLAGQEILSGLNSPTSLNQSIYPYTSRTLANTSGLNLTFVKSQRTSLTISGSYDIRQFGSQQTAGQSLYNSRGASGGLEFQHRITEHTSFGFSVLHQDSTYKGGTSVGSIARFQTESAFFFVSSHLAPTVSLTLFGGPQYITDFGQAANGGATHNLHGGGGGSITKKVKKTALDLSVQREASDSGGLYTQVEYTSATFGVRRRIAGRWETDVHGGASRIDTSFLQVGSGRAESLLGGIDFVRPFSNGTRFLVSYQCDHQLTSGTVPFAASFDRDVVTVGIDFRLKAIPLGH